jgi:aspartate/glutamate racemase
VKDCQELLQRLLAKYRVSTYIAGCTELHILVKQQEQASRRIYGEFAIDPLMEVAAMMSRCPSPALDSFHASLSA